MLDLCRLEHIKRACGLVAGNAQELLCDRDAARQDRAADWITSTASAATSRKADMSNVQTRLRNLEQASRNKAPFLVFIPDDPPTPETQAAINRARREGQFVIVLRPDDADLAL